MLLRVNPARILRVFFALIAVCAIAAFGNGKADAEEALASWYGPGFYGNPTASGEPYNAADYTAAHKTIPLGTELIVNYNGSSVPVTVNDRGPYVGSRELDLSEAAAQDLGLTQSGVDYVDYTYANSGQYAGNSQYASPAPAYEPDYAAYPQVVSLPEEATTSYGSATGGGTYTVQPGDTLTDIASSLGTSTEQLVLANGLSDPDFLSIGQTLSY